MNLNQKSCWNIPWKVTPAILLTQVEDTQPKLFIANSAHDAQRIANELRFFSPDETITEFNDRETLPYDYFSPHEDLTSARFKALNQIKNQSRGIIVTSATAIMGLLPPQTHTLNRYIELKEGLALSYSVFREKLINLGYKHTSQVWHHGEFSCRGSIIDLYPTGQKHPIRIEWFDDCIESLRSFDIDSQKSTQALKSFKCFSANEYPLTEDAIGLFRLQWRTEFPNAPTSSPVYDAVSKGQKVAGLEAYLPLFFDALESFFNYCPTNITIFFNHDINDYLTKLNQDVKERYEQLRYNTERPLLTPEKLYLSPEHILKTINGHTNVVISSTTEHHTNASPISIEPLSITPHDKGNTIDNIKFFAKQTSSIIIVCESRGRHDILSDLLRAKNIPHDCGAPHWNAALSSKAQIQLVVGPLLTGFKIKTNQRIILTEKELSGETPCQRSKKYKNKKDPNSVIKNLLELSIGGIVVHAQHGIARYLGLNTITSQGIESEFITLEYANNDKVYIPITALNMISRYSASGESIAALSKLGSNQWNKAKEKAAKRIRDIAAELLLTQSKRAMSKGYKFSLHEKEMALFRDEFTYIETPDQRSAINDVINDMHSDKCMDRLICGDVGFGKTEVAMQACFLACLNNKQSAVLVPTTLLAQQHFMSFMNRFSNWPVKIALFTRLQSPKEQERILSDLKSKKIDIIIATHKLLSDRVSFSDLGLLIIDEEQRFGVRHKDRIKQMAHHIDMLALSATPIPRTLNMSLVGTKDLSIIATPPEKRLSVRTFVHERNSELIKEAIMREMNRGGQIFFLHNDIKTMELERENIKKIIPGINIVTAHGRMNKHELETIMTDFYHQKFHVLLTTTIIESGIDVPTANTIIIDRADRFGLSQLHQLRGRVGRSHHQAYAYLFTPHHSALSADSKKRLDAIASLEELGSGFMLATHDMEIRGTGEILGEKQSGSIDTIGFTLFMDMLDRSIRSLKRGHEPKLDFHESDEIKIDLGASSLFPADYIPDVNIRLNLYKRLADLTTQPQLKDFSAELIDRFGALPIEATNLIKNNELKLKAKALKIHKINFNPVFIQIDFSDQPKIDSGKLIRLIQNQPHKYQLTSNNTLRIRSEGDNINDRINEFDQAIDKIRCNSDEQQSDSVAH